MGESLFERNLAVFAERFPAIHRRLLAITVPMATVVCEQGEAVDVDLGNGRRLYNADGRQVARATAEEYLQEPGQVGYFLPSAKGLDSMMSKRVHAEFLDVLLKHGLGELPFKAGGGTGFFFIFGVGLGYHLPILLEKINTPYVVICEAFEEFLLASFRAVDWTALIEICDRRGTALHLICASDAREIERQATDLIEEHGPVYLDGSYFFQHYPLWALDEAKRCLINDMPRQMTALGYYEDERKMVRNVFANFQKFPFHLLAGVLRPRSNVPVFVVGSGPSLDQDMPYIREWRDHVIVVSAGSGLQPCLKNGIVPDFHAELENSYPPYKKLQFILDDNKDLFPDGVFRGVRLIGAATVSPLIPPMFDERLFFFRDAVTSTLTFGQEYGAPGGIAPTALNAALATVAYLGLGDVYLFGADCGWRDNTSHHARETIYYTSDFHRTQTMKSQFVLPGNFGGTIQTDLVFDWSRNMLEQAIRAFHLNVYNCSDGALIKGATPLVAEGLSFEGEALDREAIVKAVLADFPHFDHGAFFRDHSMEPYLEQLRVYQDTLVALLGQAAGESWGFHDFHDRFWRDFVRKPVFGDLGMSGLVHYSLLGVLKHSCIFMNRITDADVSRAVMAEFLCIFRRAQADLFDGARELVGQMAAWLEKGEEPYWTNGLPEFPGTSY